MPPTIHWLGYWLGLTVSLLAGWFSIDRPAFAQIIPDNTLPINSQIAPGCTVCTIDGGTQVGGNLFHSFSQFSISTGGAALFNNTLAIQNILTRVTGGIPSQIDGLIQANGSANLFLLNPSGIHFGTNASLNLGGSFFASTATSLQFADGTIFSAVSPQPAPLLTVSVPIGPQLNTIPASSSISNRGNLTVPGHLSLVADRLDLQGQLVAGGNLTLQAQDTVKVRDTLTTPFLAQSGGNLTVQGNQGVDIFALNYLQSGFWSGGDLLLRSNGDVIGDAHFVAGGGWRVETLDSSLGTLLSPHDPIILAAGDVALGNYTGASLHVLAGGSVIITGNVTINAVGTTATTVNPNNTASFNGTTTYADLASFTVNRLRPIFNTDGSLQSLETVPETISIDGSARGTLDVRAGVDWTALGGLPTSPTLVGNQVGFTTAPSYPTPTGRADIKVTGNLIIDYGQPGGQVLLTNLFSPNALEGTITLNNGGIRTIAAQPAANGGDVGLYSRGNITLNNGSTSTRSLYSGTSGSISGDGGNITVFSVNGNITLSNWSSNSISTSTSFSSLPGNSTSGQGGTISFFTNNGNITLSNSPLSSYSSSNASSSSGTSTSGQGGAISFFTNNGNITLSNSNLESLSTSVSFTRNSTSGQGGAISFFTHNGNITLSNSISSASSGSNSPSLLGNSASGQGGAISFFTNNGDIALSRSDSRSTSSSSTFSGTATSGQGGAISFFTNNGDITFSDLYLDSYSYSRSSSGNTTSGQGREINLIAPTGAIISNNTTLNAFSVSGGGGNSGNGGTVALAAGRQISGLTVNTVSSGGRSGDVKIYGFGDLLIDSTKVLTAQQLEVCLATCPPTPLTPINLGARGQAGNVTVTSLGDLTFNNTLIQGDTRAGNPAGNVITTSPGWIRFQNNSRIESKTSSVGEAGNITVQAGQGILLEGTTTGLFATTALGSAGNGGTIALTAPTFTMTGGSVISGESNGIGQAGSIMVNANWLTLRGGSRMQTSTFSSGPAGSINLNIADTLSLDGSGTGLFASTQDQLITLPLTLVTMAEQGDSGQLLNNAQTISTVAGNLVNAITGNLDNMNDVDLYRVELAGNQTFSAAIANSSQVYDTRLFLFNSDGTGIYFNDDVTSSNFRSALPANHPLTPKNSGTYYLAVATYPRSPVSANGEIFSFNGFTAINNPNGSGGTLPLSNWVNDGSDQGNYTINLTGLQSIPLTQTLPGGNGGNIIVYGTTLTTTNAAKISATTEGAGNAGNITLNLATLNLNDGSSILASTAGSGKGGTVTVNASQAAQLGQGVQDASPVISVETSGAGRAGDIIINTPILTILDTARITATATATATNTEGGGSIALNASQMNLRGTVGVFAETQGQAPAGTLNLNPYQNDPTLDIALFPSSIISASTSASGNGGDLIVQAPQAITLTGAGKLAVETSSSGNAGRLSVTTQQLTLQDGVELSASSTGSGRAGDITFTTQNFSLLSGARVTTTTSSTGAAGNILVNVMDTFALDGQNTGLFASTDPGSSGQGGSIFVDPQRVTLANGAVISVNSQGNGNGGNIRLQAGNLTLRNQGAITAETASGEGGNITLQIDNRLLLRTNSLISATAGGTGNGGNLDIRTGEFMIAVPYENSDIIANAFQGKGGNINISTQAIFGLEFRSRLTPLSDITASSEFGLQGNVVINTPNVDPSRGIVQLPTSVTDASQQIAQNCRPAGETGRFVVTGRGGLPPSPGEIVVSGSTLWEDGENQNSGAATPQAANASSLTPAQGWVVNDRGDVTLVATMPSSYCDRR